MKKVLNLIENNNKSIEFEQCAFIPKEIQHEKAFCFAGNGNEFANKQPVTISDGKLVSANKDGWKLSSYADLMKSLEENPQVKTQIHNPAVGFLCPAEYVVLDIDGHGNEGLSEAKKGFVEKYGSTTYCEKSLSGNGYHMIFRCDSPITNGKINVDFGGGLEGTEVFGGLNCQQFVILTGNSNGKQIDNLPDELRETIKEAAKNRDNTKQKKFEGESNNESSYLLGKIGKPAFEIYCELFEGTVESESHKETRCVTQMFERKFGLDAHHFGVNSDGSWCLYGNDMKGGGLIEAVAVIEGCYDFEEGKINNQKDIPKLREITKERFNISEESTITIKGLNEIQKNASEARTIYKPYYPQIKNALPAVVRDFVESVLLKSDAYPEYSVANMLFVGSLITCGRAKYVLPHGYKSTQTAISFRNFILGKSSVSRKSTAVKQIESLIKDIEDKWCEKITGVPMSDFDWRECRNYTIRDKDGTIKNIVPPTLPYSSLESIYTEARLIQDFAEEGKSNRYLLNDEFGSLLKTLKRDYNAPLRDVLCKLCDGTNINKNLKKQKNGEQDTYHIKNPIFNCVIASTPDTFCSYVSEDDATSGYLYRFLFCCPSYSRKEKSRKEIRMNAEKAEVLTNSVVDELVKILMFFESAEKPMVYQFSEECDDFFEEWAQGNIKNLTGEKQLSLQARFESYINDIAIILHILSGKYTVKTVGIESFKLAAELIDGLFRPSGEFMLDGTVQDDLNKLIALCKKHSADGSPIPRSKLLKHSHMDKSRFTLLIDTLIESGQVNRIVDESSSAPIKPTFYIWSEYQN